jgi:hypothetical protein
MRSPSSHGLLALCALFATEAFAQEPKSSPPPAASMQRTLQLGPGNTIRYAAEPGDDRSEGTLSVLPMVPPPSVERGTAAQEPAAQEPNEQEEVVPSVRAASGSCGGPRARLAVRLLQLRGLYDVDEVTAPWIWQSLAFYGEGLTLTALQSDLFARDLAVELAHCEAAAVAR